MRHSQAVKDKALELRAQGLSMSEISRRLGPSQPTICRWVSPVAQASYQAYLQLQREDSERKERYRERDRARRRTPERQEYKKRHSRVYSQTQEYKERVSKNRTKKYNTDPAFRALELMRRRTRKLLRGHIIKSAHTEELLGISALELTQQWDVEYGPDWRTSRDLHIDHIRPCASFNLAGHAQQRICFNWRNLQLLSAAENMSKGDRWTEEMEWAWSERMRSLGWEGDLFLVYPVESTCYAWEA